jgi:hypothetical protein
VEKAVKQVTDRLNLEAKNREELLRKEFEGQRNVSVARIEALEKMAKDQATRMEAFQATRDRLSKGPGNR